VIEGAIKAAAFAAALGLGIAGLAMPPPAFAGSLTVAPTTIDLKSDRDIGVLHLSNESGAPMVAQLEAFDWTQENGADKLTPTTSLIVSPPMAKMAPGADQIVRLQAADAGGPSERTFRLLVTQLPDPAAPKVQGVNLLLQFSVPVFVHVEKREEKANVNFRAGVRGSGLWLSVLNAGHVHLKLTRIDLSVGEARGKHLSTTGLFYLLAGAERTWTFSGAPIANGEPVHIEAYDASGGPPIVADIVAHNG
jgi:fimbrial chaperone protein